MKSKSICAGVIVPKVLMSVCVAFYVLMTGCRPHAADEGLIESDVTLADSVVFEGVSSLAEEQISMQPLISSSWSVSDYASSSLVSGLSSAVISSSIEQSSQSLTQSAIVTVSSQIQISSTVDDDGCFEPFAYQGGSGYPGGSKVSFKGNNYQNIYWASDVITPDKEQAWESLGLCGDGAISSDNMGSSSQASSSSSQVNLSSQKEDLSSQSQNSSTQTSSMSSQIPDADRVAGWLSEEIFQRAFPQRNAFYSWEAFTDAFEELQSLTGPGTFQRFLREGSQTAREREAAAFFANIVQETGTGQWNSGLHYIVETCAASGSPNGNCVGYGSSAPHYYYGRGPMQLSWDYNYEAFSQSYYGSKALLLNNPSILQNDAKVAWLAAMWFWNRVDPSWSNPPPAIHDVMVNAKSYRGSIGFGGTIKAINGGLECPSSGNSKAQRRISFYASMQGVLGLSQDSQNLNCF